VFGYETLLSTNFNLPSKSILNPGKVKSGKHHIREVMTGKHETLEYLHQAYRIILLQGLSGKLGRPFPFRTEDDQS
jgi:hypothetical protein